MKNRQKITVWIMITILLLGEMIHLMNISSSIVWANEAATVTSQSQDPIGQSSQSESAASAEVTTETESSQSQEEATEKTPTEEPPTTKSDSSAIPKRSIRATGNISGNPGAEKALEEAKTSLKQEIERKFSSLQQRLGNYADAQTITEFDIPIDIAPETSIIGGGNYSWTYKTKLYVDRLEFPGNPGDGITYSGSASTKFENGKYINTFRIVVKRTKPGSNQAASPNPNLYLHAEMEVTEYFGGAWARDESLEQSLVRSYPYLPYANVEPDGIPSNYSAAYDVWRKAAVQNIADNAADSIKSNYRKLGKNVYDTIDFAVPSKIHKGVTTNNIDFSGDYFSDQAYFQLAISGDLSNYVLLEKINTSQTTISYRMKRIKTGNPAGSYSATINTRHDALGHKILIKDGYTMGWALPMKTIPSDSASASFNVADERKILADVKEQTIELGTRKDEVPAAQEMITNVRLDDGTAIDSSEYTVEVAVAPDFYDMALTDKIDVKIVRKSNNAETHVYVPVKMIWGNTIQLRGYYDQTAGAYTLHKLKAGSYVIRSTFGINKKYDSSGVHSVFSQKLYHSITLLRGSGNLTQLPRIYYKETLGNETAQSVVSNFGTNGQQSVELGDIVKIWHQEPGTRHVYFANEKELQAHHGFKEVYYVITKNGFVPLRVNHLKTKEKTIGMSTTDAELNQKKDEMIDFQGMTGNDLKVTKITQYPDRSKAGATKGKVLVEETVAGHTHTYEYEVPFKVEDDRKLKADVVEQTITLGTRSDELPSASSMVTNVRLSDGTSLSADEYTTELIKSPAFDQMAVTDKLEVKLTRKSNNQSIQLSVPVKMIWGSTIQLRGYYDQTAGAYTLHKLKAGSYVIRSTFGINKEYDSSGVHSVFSQKLYHSITLLRGSGNLTQLSRIYYKETLGNETAQSVVSNFGTNGQQSVELGDIVKIWHQEPGTRHVYFSNEKEIQAHHGFKEVYYVVTENGFVPLRVNHLKTKEKTINMSTTDAELDQKKDEMIDFQGMTGNDLKVTKITQYPDRAKPGETTGKLMVEETVAGHTHTYEYEVPFKVEDDRKLKADVVEQPITLGTQADELPSASSMVTNVRLSDGTALSADEYTTELIKSPTFDQMAVIDKLEVKLTRKSNNQSIQLSIPVKMIWGSTIQLRGDYDKTAGAYTLRKIGNSYYIRATFGEDNDYQSQIHWYFKDGPYYTLTVLRGKGQLDAFTNIYHQQANGDQSAADVINSFGNKGEYQVQLGDIVRIWHQEPGIRHVYFANEKELQAHHGFKEVYYVVTENGFVPLRVNHLKTKEKTIDMNTTDAELDQKKDEMIDFQGMTGNDLKVTNITQYPDRSKAGATKGKVLVEETIGGQTYAYEYEVAFQVEDNRQPQADVVEQTITLGTRADELPNASSMVTNVRLTDGTPLSADEYMTEITKSPTFDQMAVTDNIEIKLTRKSNNKSIKLSVPVKMNWGNTIQLRGNYDKTAGAYTLHKLKTGDYAIRSTFGISKDYEDSGVHWFFAETVYHSFTVLRGTGNLTIYEDETKGKETVPSVVSNFGKDGQLDVQLGDVIALEHKEQQRNFYTVNGVEVGNYSLKKDDGTTYFAVTEEGFKPYRVNQLKANRMKISVADSDKDLDLRKDEMIDFQGMTGNDLKVTRIIKYPDRSRVGESIGKVRVEETIRGIKRNFDYEVPFDVQATALTLETSLSVENLSRKDSTTRVGDELLYVYTLKNNTVVGALKSGTLQVELPADFELLKASEKDIKNVVLPKLSKGQAFTLQFTAEVKESALGKNPVVKIAGQAVNESDQTQDILEKNLSVPGATVEEEDKTEINVTIPVKMRFGAEDDKIISPIYHIQNNSKVPVEVMVDDFTADTELNGKNVTLNLTSEDQQVNLFENDKEMQIPKPLLVLTSKQKKQVAFSGSVKAQKEVSKSSSTLLFRFIPNP